MIFLGKRGKVLKWPAVKVLQERRFTAAHTNLCRITDEKWPLGGQSVSSEMMGNFYSKHCWRYGETADRRKSKKVPGIEWKGWKWRGFSHTFLFSISRWIKEHFYHHTSIYHNNWTNSSYFCSEGNITAITRTQFNSFLTNTHSRTHAYTQTYACGPLGTGSKETCDRGRGRKSKQGQSL